MSYSPEDILARNFFDLADRLQQISKSDTAKEVSSFGEADYASLVASILDAAYWILAGQLDEETEEYASGAYVSVKVYSDMLRRGFSATDSWRESGIEQFFDSPEEFATED